MSTLVRRGCRDLRRKKDTVSSCLRLSAIYCFPGSGVVPSVPSAYVYTVGSYIHECYRGMEGHPHEKSHQIFRQLVCKDGTETQVQVMRLQIVNSTKLEL